MKTLLLGTFAVALWVVAGPAGAQISLPEVETRGDIRIWSGGTGTEEREAMAASDEGFDVKVVFSRVPNGAFESGVDVTVERTREPALELDGVGPWLFLDLPAGSYTIVAESRGETIRESVELDGTGLRHVGVRFTEPQPENQARSPEPGTEAEGSSLGTTTERRESIRVYERPAGER